MMADGKGDDLVRDPKRSFPSYISAATFMDIANRPAESKDFFGVQTPNPGVTRIQCPLLAFFGTRGDVGIRRNWNCSNRPSSGSRAAPAACIPS